jgi:hypothetical protein
MSSSEFEKEVHQRMFDRMMGKPVSLAAETKPTCNIGSIKKGTQWEIAAK